MTTSAQNTTIVSTTSAATTTNSLVVRAMTMTATATTTTANPTVMTTTTTTTTTTDRSTSTATTTTAIVGSSETDFQSTSASNIGPDIGLIAGAAAGGAVALLVIGAVVFLVCRSQKARGSTVDPPVPAAELRQSVYGPVDLRAADSVYEVGNVGGAPAVNSSNYGFAKPAEPPRYDHPSVLSIER